MKTVTYVRPVSGIHDGEDDRLTNTRSRFEKVPEEPTVALPPPQEPSGKLYEVSRDIHEQPTEINSGNEDKPLKQYDPTRDIHGNLNSWQRYTPGRKIDTTRNNQINSRVRYLMIMENSLEIQVRSSLGEIKQQDIIIPMNQLYPASLMTSTEV